MNLRPMPLAIMPLATVIALTFVASGKSAQDSPLRLGVTLNRKSVGEWAEWKYISRFDPRYQNNTRLLRTKDIIVAIQYNGSLHLTKTYEQLNEAKEAVGESSTIMIVARPRDLSVPGGRDFQLLAVTISYSGRDGVSYSRTEAAAASDAIEEVQRLLRNQ